MADLTGQVALVTGASTGIGRAIAHGLAARGATIIGMARTGARIQAAMAEIEDATGSRTVAIARDVTARDWPHETLRAAGLDAIDLLVNNAGVIDAAEVPIWAADPDQWWDVVTSHIRGAQLLVHAVVPGMIARGSGRVVNMASGMSTRGEPDYSAYSVAKTGLMRLTETLAAALEGSGVRAFDVAPGIVETPMTTSMPKWDGFTDWTPPERVVELVATIAAGELDDWSGRYLRAGIDDLDTIAAMTPDGVARQLRLRSYGENDPLG